MPWSKNGDFNSYYNELYPNMCSYSHTGSLIETIHILKHISGDQHITIDFSTTELALQFRQKLLEADMVVSKPPSHKPSRISLYKVNSSNLPVFLAQLRKVEPCVKEIAKDIVQNFNIDLSLGITLQDLTQKPFIEAIDLLLELQQNEHYELSYELLNFHWKQNQLPVTESKGDVSLKEVYEFGEMISNIIPKNSPFFDKVHKICLDILMQRGLDAPAGQEKIQSLDEETPLDVTRYFELLKAKFKHALHADPDLTKPLYRELCGIPLDEKKLQKVEGDYDTLIEVADILRDTNMKLNEALQKQDTKLPTSPMFFPSTPSTVNPKKPVTSESGKNDSPKKDKNCEPNSPQFRRPGT